MLQTPPTDDLRDKFHAILTPGYHYPYHPTILIGSQIPITTGRLGPGVSGPPPHVIPDCLIAFDVDTAAIWARVGYDPIQNGKPPTLLWRLPLIALAATTRCASGRFTGRLAYRNTGDSTPPGAGSMAGHHRGRNWSTGSTVNSP